uniref:Uncharacterized protein n=2 Tax=Lactuca sativa TaxID=4236 RepID=A0A9R1WTK1_LACSA|nr:hypothetical protein LSAT_V11C900474960 [Lactuca sativa]
MPPLLPTFPMTVYYGNERVFNGREFKACDVDIAPRVFIGGGPSELYTLIMIDPDAPDPSDPCLKQVVSCVTMFIICLLTLKQCVVFRIVINIRGGTSHSQGTEVVPYEASSPEVGIHRNIFVLYKQQSQLDNIETLASRFCFNIRAFATENNLGNPVRVTYFNMRQTNKRKRGE